MRFTEFKNNNKELESALVNTLTNLRGEADDEAQEEVYQFKLATAHDLADEYKAKIQGIFQSTFR